MSRRIRHRKSSHPDRVIIDTAKQSDIPVHKDEKLAGSLKNIEIGEYIPPELYQVVADVLVFVDAMDHIKDKVMDHRKER